MGVRLAGGLVAGLVVFGMANGAEAIVLDFETRDPINSSTTAVEGRFNDLSLYPNTMVAYSQFLTSFGVILSTPNPASNPLALFNSNCIGTSIGPRNLGFCEAPGGNGDADLATGPDFDSPAEGLILIVNENNNGPTDDVVGGDVIFDFVGEFGVNLTSIVLIDLDETLPVLNAIEFVATYTDMTTQSFLRADFAANPNLTETLINPSFPNNNSYRRFDFGGDLTRNVVRLEVNYNNISGGIALLEYTPEIPLPAAMPLLLTGLGAIGVLGWRRRRAA